ncbi:MAG: thiol peroxidase [Desulfovibrio sp.]|nr:thiol peroxidase [Desulfovibrio sp.]
MNTVTFQGATLHLEGTLPKVGDKAPGFVLTANDLSEKTLADYAGKPLVIASVPSLDTPVCDLESKRFNEEAAKYDGKVQFLIVSCDLPFAQARWSEAANINNLQTLSDYKTVDFGKNYGVLIKELRLLARAVFVIDAAGVIAYEQLVPEITNQPNFAAVLEAVKKLA